ncbi:hypothetical protein O7627_32385 [Solwaraspora sp. WMMD1047]|uniref:hypothetical protein n=1 Tax=Solwaraspora sp. WMMD1047 TaxID=3016102 RepID=UPI002417B32E|nr:hypothetical protein [Solwaraspora sp. WMMD1047]MDG4833970.1 hypothetical protein [Solwaraspora sp. WMMD1047]
MPAVIVAAGIVVAPGSPAEATGRAGFCPDAAGVTVVVDFQELGGPTIVRCAVGDQATGHAALKNAGISITGTTRWGESFICRIEGRPAAAEEPCIDTPPASAYWSYWHAPNGGPWTYSQRGVMARKPPAGSFEGWSFSKNRSASTSPPPGVAPVRPAPPAATPTPTRAAPPTTSGPAAGRPPAAPDGPQVPTPPAPPGAPTGTTDPATQVTSSVAPSVGGSASAMATETGGQTQAWTGDTAPAQTQRPGLPIMTVAGAGLLVLVAGAAAVAARRRRRAE